MKISLNWLKSYLDLDAYDPNELADILTEIGLEVEGFEQVESIRGGLHGIVVGLVETCGKHPNADRLSLTTVNIGKDEPLQIVCGAPNVAAGQKVLVATVGTTLYTPEGESWEIRKGKIRGEVSEGMICAEDELGLGTDHSGIMVLRPDVVIGQSARQLFDVNEDVIFEIGLTPNRSDATCHLGVARDLAAALRINYNDEAKIIEPDISQWRVDAHTLPIQVKVEQPEACPRYAGVSIQGITVKESPDWLKQRLMAVGVRPINNVVDVTNFVLHEMGQPLHAFDYKAITGQQIRVMTLPKGTAFASLDEQERSLSDQDLMICDGAANGMCIAGVFGGIHSGVKADTTDLFLESAHFNGKWVRRTSGRHLLFTDAAKVFEKGSDPNICVAALKRAAILICELSGGKIASEIVDVYPEPVEPRDITLRFKRLNTLVGTNIPTEEVLDILEAMDMQIVVKDETAVQLKVPTNKADVVREADLIEEVLRIYGFNRVPVFQKMQFAIQTSTKPDATAVRNRVADYLSSVGFLEMMAMSMVDKKYIEEVFQTPDDTLVRINNTSNVQVEVMRPNLLVSALDTVRHNQFRQQQEIRLFEFGKSYRKLEGEYREQQHLSVTLSGWSRESWLAPNLPSDKEYYVLKSVAEHIFTLLGIDGWRSDLGTSDLFDQCLSYYHGKDLLGQVGWVRRELCEGMDVKGAVTYLEFDWDAVLKGTQVDAIKVQEISKYPSVRRDLALVVDQNVDFEDIAQVVKRAIGKSLEQINLFDVYDDARHLGEGKKSYAISMSFRDPAKTFSDKEIDSMLRKVLNQLEKKIGARLR